MTRSANQFFVDRPADRQQAIREYLADLPILDRMVLHHKHVNKMETPRIALELSIGETHVERILQRAREFRGRPVERPVLRHFPLSSKSPLASCQG